MSNQDAQNQESLRRLILTVQANSQSLELLIAVCDDRNLQVKVIEQYEAELREKGIAPFRVRLNPKEPSLRRSVTALVEEEARLQSGQPAVVTVLNAEALLGVTLGEEKSEQERFFFSLQWTREALLRFEFAVVLWLPEQMATRMGQRSPDFWSWRGGVFEFARGQELGGVANTSSSFVTSFDKREVRQEEESVERLLVQVQELEKDVPESALLITLYNDLGDAYKGRYAYGEALVWYEKGFALTQKKANLEGQVRTLRNIGDALLFSGRLSDSIRYYERLLEINREIGDRNGEARSLGSLGIAYYSLSQYQRAISFYQQSLKIAQEIGDRQGEANSLGNLGNTYYYLGQYQRAIDFHQQQLEIAREIGDRQGEAASLSNLGSAYGSLGQYQRTIDFNQQQFEIVREIGDRQGEAASIGNLGNAHYSLGEYQQAIDFHQQSLEIARELGDRNGEANSQFNSGLVFVKLHQKEAARTAFKEAQQLYAAMGLSKKVKKCKEQLQSLNESEQNAN